MVRLRAVGFGLAVIGVLSFFGLLIPFIGHAAGGMAGGLVAGILGGGTYKNGLEHGFITGIIGGLFIGTLGMIVSQSIGFGSPVTPKALLRIAPWMIAFSGAIVLFLCSCLGGIVGAIIRGDRPLPHTAK